MAEVVAMGMAEASVIVKELHAIILSDPIALLCLVS
jgi:hypothetical protein